MMRLLGLGLTFGLCAFLVHSLTAAPTDKEKVKEALAALQDFIGDWKANGGPDKVKPAANDPIWTENLKWTWRFKGDDVWLNFEVKDGKLCKSGEVRYLLDKKQYQLTAVDKDDKKLVFAGAFD